MPTTPQLPPLPEPELLGAEVSGHVAEFYGHTDATLHARDRQIVELCASLIEARSLNARRIRAAMNSEPIKPCEEAAAIRALLGDKGEV